MHALCHKCMSVLFVCCCCKVDFVRMLLHISFVTKKMQWVMRSTFWGPSVIAKGMITTNMYVTNKQKSVMCFACIAFGSKIGRTHLPCSRANIGSS